MIDSYILSVWLSTPLTSAGEERGTFSSKNYFKIKTILFIINFRRNYAICYGQVAIHKGGCSMKIVILKDILKKLILKKVSRKQKQHETLPSMQRVLNYVPVTNLH